MFLIQFYNRQILLFIKSFEIFNNIILQAKMYSTVSSLLSDVCWWWERSVSPEVTFSQDSVDSVNRRTMQLIKRRELNSAPRYCCCDFEQSDYAHYNTVATNYSYVCKTLYVFKKHNGKKGTTNRIKKV